MKEVKDNFNKVAAYFLIGTFLSFVAWYEVNVVEMGYYEPTYVIWAAVIFFVFACPAAYFKLAAINAAQVERANANRLESNT